MEEKIMKAGFFAIAFVLLGGAALMFGTPFIASLGVGGIIGSIIIGIVYLALGIFLWEKFGDKSS